ncbi:N-acetyltransferase GCN5 [Sulfuricella denitrificans skB26]|uniref:N-acetyltransferase GCN5 n=1 Tax=Sulfuricella denitrificans (strain DSM 22764 / NBRC 105220 / skB26) TaxID=1163617 RepID=S6B8K9_SULDS|nr:GNAT family N-acetyltransferase [Sulfuricella denitrificans]BAN36687.1 N-acetyltransferase GCN5 [Sulfuricella denitrificans skB26]
MSLIKPTPWDTVVFGVPTWELTEYSEKALQQATQEVGHYTIKVDPLVDKRLLHEHGFYYCDTLIEPHCSSTRLRAVQHPEAKIAKDIDVKQALVICHGAFSHGRFHRDFNLPMAAADLRYENWLKQLLEVQQVYGLYWQGELAGFIGHSGNNLVLHALAEKCRGKGRSKYWWSAVCGELLRAGHYEVKSSISVSNLAVLNLYASLGFIFRNPQDIYHRMTS